MTMRWARILVLFCGIALPYLARLPGGLSWLKQYTDVGIVAWLFFGAFNAIAWGAILMSSAACRHPVSLLAPAVPGFAFLAWAHGTLDLASDAQAAIALVIIPVLALIPISVGGWVGSVIDRRLIATGG